jgi:hypothetical protein
MTVRNILRSQGYSLQGYINTTAAQFLFNGDPVISVDAKKRELVGRFAQTGREWHPSGPTKIKVTNQQKQATPLARHEFQGDWNYTITPTRE